jgi:hypothetical protein
MTATAPWAIKKERKKKSAASTLHMGDGFFCVFLDALGKI